MKTKHGAKNDFLYAAVMFAMFAVLTFNVVMAVVELHPDAYVAYDTGTAASRVATAEADAHAVTAPRAA